ncbi:MAG: pseudouridine synthase [Pseudomonadota bacterium]
MRRPAGPDARGPRDSSEPSGERLQKVLANSGVASRREVERWITAGRITVNGEVATLGLRVGRTDVVRVDGERIAPRAARRTRVLRYHKPAGEVTTRRDEQDRPTVFENLPGLRSGRWINVGRLDVNTAGLLLFTNDGELAHRLMHPRYRVEREYAVRVIGEVSDPTLELLRTGVSLDGEIARFESIDARGGTGVNQWFHVTLMQGRNREVRRLWESQGTPVSRLIRVRFANVSLPRSLRPGRWEELDDDAVRELQSGVGLASAPARPARAPRGKRRTRHSGSRGSRRGR